MSMEHQEVWSKKSPERSEQNGNGSQSLSTWDRTYSHYSLTPRSPLRGLPWFQRRDKGQEQGRRMAQM